MSKNSISACTKPASCPVMNGCVRNLYLPNFLSRAFDCQHITLQNRGGGEGECVSAFFTSLSSPAFSLCVVCYFLNVWQAKRQRGGGAKKI
jgi:hypothetical protein